MSGTDPAADSLLRTPEGACCHAGADAATRRRIEETAAAVFRGWSYEEVLLPIFDHADVFARAGGRWSERNSYRFLEGGDLLSLRTDFTALAAKAAVTRLPRDARRLFYRGEVVRRAPRRLGPAALREAGVEHFAGGPAADVEVLLVAMEVLERLGVKRPLFTLGHAGFPLGLLDDALAPPSGGSEPVASEAAERVRQEALRGVWRRDRARLEDALGAARGGSSDPAAEAARRALVESLDLVGDAEVLGTAGGMSLPPRSKAAIERLATIAGVLDRLGAGASVRFDLAELRGFDYYTGLVFEIHAGDVGREVGGGGRYDDLLGRFGADRPAVGFSISVDRIAALPPPAAPLSEPAEAVRPDSDAAADLAACFHSARSIRDRGGAVRVGNEPEPAA